MNKSPNGFSLLEVLVAILLTSLFVSVFAQLFAIARGGDRIPAELFAAVAKGRELLVQSPRAGPEASASFREEVKLSRLSISENPDRIAPAIRSGASSQPSQSVAQPAPGSSQPAPASQQAAPAPRRRVRAIKVVVIDPSGRRTEMDGVTSLAP